MERTKPEFTRSILPEQINLDSFSLKNYCRILSSTNLFNQVVDSVKIKDNDSILIFHLKERVARLPILFYEHADGTFLARAGLTDFNWLGRGNKLYLLYQHYFRSSINFNQTIYSLKGSKLGLFTDIKLVRTLEPVTIGGERLNYLYNLNAFEQQFIYSPSFRSRFFLGGGLLHEYYRAEVSPETHPEAELYKGIFKVGFEGNYQTYSFEELEGHYHRIFAETIASDVQVQTFKKIEMENKGFLMYGRSNFAFRNLIGLSNVGETPFGPFILDNFTNVRGVGFKVARSKGHWTLNYEYRYTFYRNRNCGNIWCNSLQAVTFFDQSYWLFSSRSYKSMFTRENTKLFGGFGFRWTFHRFNGAALRFDYSFDLMNPKNGGTPLIGIGQFF